jgi:hypothetical protein
VIATPYVGSGPYCYANCLAMVLGPDAPPPSTVEVLTGSPFGFELIAGSLPLFDPYGWDPDQGLDDAVRLLGYTCVRQGADDDRHALALLRDMVRSGPVLAGPLEMGLLRHQPGMTGPIEADHFVVVLEVEDALIRFHDPNGHPYATLPGADFLAAWRADTIAYRSAPYTMRSAFERVRPVTVEEALRGAVDAAVGWLRGRTDLPVPPGTLGGEEAVLALADRWEQGPDPRLEGHLSHFAIRVGARRLADAATALTGLGLSYPAAIATTQARLVGSLQDDVVGRRPASVAATLRSLAPGYREWADALTAPAGAFGSS